MIGWLLMAVIAASMGAMAHLLFPRRWQALTAAGLLALLLAPYVALRVLWATTGQHDAQDGLAIVFGPLLTVPVAVLATLMLNHWRPGKR
ncbi:hypothetical protein [Pseudoxanthomonas composti]|uniref:Uncharacterized protein n=1 Tax=Pseudoxanthomonas composti TaxID=2137479 RepID=A0A4Q1JW18_9GAMM|nr:hypothetical protein [Pseudoxanthomonas composti]RXR06473.1 hypothetical protein EPA99_07445 [Pseudoxanthomonas composti]